MVWLFLFSLFLSLSVVRQFMFSSRILCVGVSLFVYYALRVNSKAEIHQPFTRARGSKEQKHRRPNGTTTIREGRGKKSEIGGGNNDKVRTIVFIRKKD